MRETNMRQFFRWLIHFPGSVRDRIFSGVLTGILTGAGLIPVFFIQYTTLWIAVHLTLYVIGYCLALFLVWRWIYLPKTAI